MAKAHFSSAARSCGLLLACSALLLAGCAAYRRATTVDSTFIEDVDVASTIDNIPLDHVWVKPGFDRRQYRAIYLKPIRTDLLPEAQWERSLSGVITSKEEYQAAAGEVAEFFKASLESRIRDYPDNKVLLVERPEPGAIILEIALTELEFAHPIANASALVAPIPGTGQALSAITDPHAAFAARFTDESGQLVATIADRQFPPARIVDLHKLSVSSSVREVCEVWSEILAEAINKGRFQRTSNRGRFSLLPW